MNTTDSIQRGPTFLKRDIKRLADCPRVYVLLANRAPVYVGFTKYTKKRLYAHFAPSGCFKPDSFFLFPSRISDTWLEREVISELKPRHNFMFNPISNWRTKLGEGSKARHRAKIQKRIAMLKA